MFGLLIADAQAQAATAAPATGQPGLFMNMLPLVAVFMVFYFLMIRPQKKKLEQEKQYLANIQKGEEIYLKSGIIGVVHGITDKIITLEVENGGKLKVLKSAIGGPTKDMFAKSTKAQA